MLAKLAERVRVNEVGLVESVSGTTSVAGNTLTTAFDDGLTVPRLSVTIRVAMYSPAIA